MIFRESEYSRYQAELESLTEDVPAAPDEESAQTSAGYSRLPSGLAEGCGGRQSTLVSDSGNT